MLLGNVGRATRNLGPLRIRCLNQYRYLQEIRRRMSEPSGLCNAVGESAPVTQTRPTLPYYPPRDRIATLTHRGGVKSKPWEISHGEAQGFAHLDLDDRHRPPQPVHIERIAITLLSDGAADDIRNPQQRLRRPRDVLDTERGINHSLGTHGVDELPV